MFEGRLETTYFCTKKKTRDQFQLENWMCVYLACLQCVYLKTREEVSFLTDKRVYADEDEINLTK